MPDHEFKDSLDRRTLLAGATAAALAGTGVPKPGLAQGTTALGSIKRVDTHTHFTSLKYLETAENREGRPYELGGMFRSISPLHDLSARLNLLDRNEIDVHVLVPVPWLEAFPRIANDKRLATETARLANDETAAIVAAQPKRFRGVAMLPAVDPEAMVSELYRAHSETNGSPRLRSAL